MKEIMHTAYSLPHPGLVSDSKMAAEERVEGGGGTLTLLATRKVILSPFIDIVTSSIEEVHSIPGIMSAGHGYQGREDAPHYCTRDGQQVVIVKVNLVETVQVSIRRSRRVEGCTHRAIPTQVC